jgi:hypothetical protein
MSDPEHVFKDYALKNLEACNEERKQYRKKA